MVSVADLPGGGGAWATYVRQLGPLAGFDPAPYTTVGRDLQHAIEQRDDPGAWLAFAAASARLAWQGLPTDLRNELLDYVDDLVLDGLETIGNNVGPAASAALANVGEVIPLIGALLQPIIDFVVSVVKTAKAMDDIREQEAAIHRQWRQFQTLKQLDDPNEWVFGITQVLNYTARAGHEWRRRPCLRSGYGADRIFSGKLGTPDSGACDKGVLYDCPAIYRSDNYEDCEPKYPEDAGKECIRFAGYSALYWPFWSPSYAPDPIPLMTAHTDPNALLIARQIALLSNPNVNLRVNGNRVLSVADTFVDWFFDQIQVYAPQGSRFGLLAIDNEGFAPGTSPQDRLTVDERKQKDFVPTGPERNKFYFGDNGLIHAYDYSGADPRYWGVRAAGGPSKLAISVAQYNAVVGNTLAFFTARANFLRSGPVMSALVREFGSGSFSHDVRDAIEYSAAYGKLLPPISAVGAAGPGVEGSIVAPSGSGGEGNILGRPIPGAGVPPDRMPKTQPSSGLTRGQAVAVSGLAAVLAAWVAPTVVSKIARMVRRR